MSEKIMPAVVAGPVLEPSCSVGGRSWGCAPNRHGQGERHRPGRVGHAAAGGRSVPPAAPRGQRRPWSGSRTGTCVPAGRSAAARIGSGPAGGVARRGGQEDGSVGGWGVSRWGQRRTRRRRRSGSPPAVGGIGCSPGSSTRAGLPWPTTKPRPAAGSCWQRSGGHRDERAGGLLGEGLPRGGVVRRGLEQPEDPPVGTGEDLAGV
jgi:hypothetical protein